MSARSSSGEERSPSRGDSDGEPEDVEELWMDLALLARENRRLRESYTRVRTTQYRRTAIGFAVLGLIAVAGGLAFPDARTVLFALAGTGLFGAILTYYVTPERFVPASVGREVYDALAINQEAIADQLGLTEYRIYVPTDAGSGVRLFVPQRDSYAIPDEDARSRPFVVTENERERGVCLRPTGEALFSEFERTLTTPLAAEPVALLDQLTDGLAETFELATGVDPDVDANGRATIRVSASTLGPIDRFDHPVASFLAVGLARGLSRPVSVETVAIDEGSDAYLVTYRWETDTMDDAGTEGDVTTDDAARDVFTGDEPEGDEPAGDEPAGDEPEGDGSEEDEPESIEETPDPGDEERFP